MIDLEKLTAETQAEADDASGDYHYVQNPQDAPVIRVALATRLDDDPDEKQIARRVDILRFAIVSAIRMHRANGGIGRGVVTYKRTDDGIEAHWTFWTSTADAFAAIRTQKEPIS